MNLSKPEIIFRLIDLAGVTEEAAKDYLEKYESDLAIG